MNLFIIFLLFSICSHRTGSRGRIDIQFTRTFVGMAVRFVGRQALKLRYWVIGGGVAGASAAGNVRSVYETFRVFDKK